MTGLIPTHYTYSQRVVPIEGSPEAVYAPRTNEIVIDGKGYLKTYKDLVVEEFGQDSVMVDVARCESHYNQYNIVDKTIKVLRGKSNPDDIGIFEINVEYHGTTARDNGYDIYTPLGNIQFARYLYDTYGTSPWNWSKKCWESKIGA